MTRTSMIAVLVLFPILLVGSLVISACGDSGDDAEYARQVSDLGTLVGTALAGMDVDPAQPETIVGTGTSLAAQLRGYRAAFADVEVPDQRAGHHAEVLAALDAMIAGADALAAAGVADDMTESQAALTSISAAGEQMQVAMSAVERPS